MSEALVIVDFQRDFTPPDGALAVPGGDQIAGRLNELASDQHYELVLATRDWHPPDHSSFRAQGGPWPVHCVQGTDGAELHPSLDQRLIDAVIDKGQRQDSDGYSAFEAEELGLLLREHTVTALTIVGLATDYCVLNTARDALKEGFAVTVDLSATRAVDAAPGDGERALAQLEQLGALVTDLAPRKTDSLSQTEPDPIAANAAEIAARAERELEALVAVSSPSGDLAGAEEAIALCAALLPPEATIERVPCSTAGGAPDLLGRLSGTGERRLLLLGHLDTVVDHIAHSRLRNDGDRLYGPGTADMKGGVVLALGVARMLAARPDRFAELALLLVTDEEWRTAAFAHVQRFAGYDACLCFEAGERSADGGAGVVVRRKAAGTLRVRAVGRAAHSGSAPDQGRNALLALATVALTVSERHDPSGPERLTVVPTVLRSGDALNVVPADGELVFDLRADRLEAFDPLLAAVPAEVDGAAIEAAIVRRWPAMDSEAATEAVLARATARLGRRVVGVARGGASDASHFAASIPLTIDGLGPRGGGAHTPGEFVLRSSLADRAEVALTVAQEVLDGAQSAVA